ncbi:hypothetical protein ACEYW6_09895 [Nostoc sp. UIC 10607]
MKIIDHKDAINRVSSLNRTVLGGLGDLPGQNITNTKRIEVKAHSYLCASIVII